MPFKKLQQEFLQFCPKSPADSANDEETYRFLMLRCMFEIAGNLDTIAVCQREIVDIARENREEIEILKRKSEERDV